MEKQQLQWGGSMRKAPSVYLSLVEGISSTVGMRERDWSHQIPPNRFHPTTSMFDTKKRERGRQTESASLFRMADGEGDVKVLSAWFSMFGMRVLIALEEKNVPYQLIEEDLSNKSELLMQSNPIHKKIPVLLHEGKPICESSIIVEYINETWPSPPLFNPSTPFNTSLHRFWAHYIDSKFYDAASKVVKSPAGEAQEGAIRELVESYKMMEKALTDMSCGVKPFFGGDSMGLVDVVFAPFISWFNAYETIGGCKLPGEDECPLLSAWVKRVSEVPSVKKVLPDSNRMIEFAHWYREYALNTNK